MRKIKYDEIVARLREEVIRINCVPDSHLLDLYDRSIASETSKVSRGVLETLKENALIAGERMIPICQDTGTLVCFVELGVGVEVEGGFLYDAISDGVEAGYRDGYLRKSIVGHPISRVNTGNNLPPVIHTELKKDDRLTLTIMAKGAGSENMSALRMLAPSDGIEGVRRFVIETVKKAGPNPCPPITVGVGIGGNFEGVAMLAKKALVKDLGDYPEDEICRDLDQDLQGELNRLGIGAQGFGGSTSVFEVRALAAPCHIASLPVAVNINCHVIRHKKIEF